MKTLLKILFFSLTSLVLADDWQGTESTFHSYQQHDFKIEGVSCKVVTPQKAAKGKPWIWRARFWGHEPQTDIALLKEGLHLVYADVAGLYGSPEAVERWDKVYQHLTTEHSFAKKVALEGMSRGGLIIYNWSAKNPDKVACIYADAPVCDFKSWPKLNPAVLKAYDLTEEEARAYQGNPVDNLKPLAEAKIPLLHVVGDADEVVPVSENTAVIEARYKALGGSIKVIHKPGVGHHPHSLKEPKLIVDFIVKYAKTPYL